MTLTEAITELKYLLPTANLTQSQFEALQIVLDAAKSHDTEQQRIRQLLTPQSGVSAPPQTPYRVNI